MEIRIDAFLVWLGHSDASRLIEDLQLRLPELAGQMIEAMTGPVSERPIVQAPDNFNERRILAEAVEFVILRGHEVGEPLDSLMTLHRLRCLLIEAGNYRPPWDESAEPDHDPTSSE